MAWEPSDFGACPCGGQYDDREVDVQMTVSGEEITLEAVRQGACPLCGSLVYKPHVLERLEAVLAGRAGLTTP
jgi:hypothetical protein